MEEAAVTLSGEYVAEQEDLEEGIWYVPVKNEEAHFTPFKVTRVVSPSLETSAGLFGEKIFNALDLSGEEATYSISKRGNVRRKDSGAEEKLKLIPYHGMNIWEEVSQEDELLDADEILGKDEEVVLPAEKVRKSLQGETEKGEEITTDEQPTSKEADKYVAFYVSPLYRDRFR